MRKKKKRKIGVKKKSAKRSAPKKKVSRKKASKSKAARLVVGAMAAIAAPPDDPLGACYWVDTDGQNHCQVTTQSACKALPQSSFRPNKQCPGGV